MPKFKYTAIDQAGKQNTGKIDATNLEQARAKLQNKGLMISQINEIATASAGSAKGAGMSFGKIVDTEGLTIFTRQLATLLQAGLPLLKALIILRNQERNPRFKQVLVEVCDQIESGNTLSDSFGQHPKVFDRLYINMIRAGEAGGVLDTVLGRLAGFSEKSLKIQKKVKSAMIYPSVVVTVAVGIVYLLMVKVVPQFEKMIMGQKGMQMPPLTKMVINTSKVLTEYWYLPPVVLVALYVGLKAWLSTPAGKAVFDKLVLKLPKIGNFVRIVAVSRFARTFGTLMSSGVPILQAITITKETLSNALIADALGKVHDSVKDGEALSVPLEQTGVFPPMVVSMIQVGEETGQLPEMLNRVADTYDEEVDNTVSSLTSIIEPVLIVFLAVVVGTIVIAMFQPLIGLISNMAGGR